MVLNFKGDQNDAHPTKKRLLRRAVRTYTAQDAVDDGVFVEASRDTHPGWMLTRAVYEQIKKVEGFTDVDYLGLGWRQRVVPLLMDAALIADERPDHLWTKGLEGNLTGKTLWIAQNDVGGLTLMFPEDY